MAQADFKLIVGADTTEARRELDEIRAAAENVKAARGEPSVGGSPVPSSGSAGAASPAKQSRKAAQEFGKEAGGVAGSLIGKAVAGFMVHQVAGTILSSMRTVGGDNRNVDRAESSLNGALGGALMGSKFGPLGALVGGLGGAAMNLWGQHEKERMERESASLNIRMADHRRTVDSSVSMSDRAFSEELGFEGNWKRRIGMMADRAGTIYGGDGAWSIRNLEASLKKKTPGTVDYDVTAKNLEMQKNRLASLQQKMFEEALPWRPRSMEAGEVTDSFAKRGIEVGAQVDVASVNDRILDEVKAMRITIGEIARKGTDAVHTVDSMFNAAGVPAVFR